MKIAIRLFLDLARGQVEKPRFVEIIVLIKAFGCLMLCRRARLETPMIGGRLQSYGKFLVALHPHRRRVVAQALREFISYPRSCKRAEVVQLYSRESPAAIVSP